MIDKLLKWLKGKFVIEPKLKKVCQDFDNNELDKDVEKFAVDFVHGFEKNIEDPEMLANFKEYKEMWIAISAYFIERGFDPRSIETILHQEMERVYK